MTGPQPATEPTEPAPEPGPEPTTEPGAESGPESGAGSGAGSGAPDLSAFWAAADRFTAVVQAGGTWSGPSPCPGWSAADVVRHVVETQRSFLSDRGLDLGAAPDDADPVGLWSRHLDSLRRVLADPAAVARRYDGWFGTTTVGASLLRFYGFDLLVHRWDLARGLGVDTALTDEELDQVEAGLAAFGDAAYAEGVCREPVPVPDDAPRQVALLARTGRQA